MAYDDGGMDGFLRASSNDEYTIGYYTQADLPFYARLLRTTWLARDRYFASILGPTFPNRLFQWAAQTDRLDDTVTFSSLPTILDRLPEAGVSHRYFFSSVPFLAMWGVKYIGSSEWFAEFLERAAAGTLPAVSFVDEIYTVLDDGTGSDHHSHADIRNGDGFLAAVCDAVGGAARRGTRPYSSSTSMNGETFSSTWHPRASQRRIKSIQMRPQDKCGLVSGCQRSWFLPLATRPERRR